MALPVLAVALVAHPGIAGCCAAAAASVMGKPGRLGHSSKSRGETPSVLDNDSEMRHKEKRVIIYG